MLLLFAGAFFHHNKNRHPKSDGYKFMKKSMKVPKKVPKLIFLVIYNP